MSCGETGGVDTAVLVAGQMITKAHIRSAATQKNQRRIATAKLLSKQESPVG